MRTCSTQCRSRLRKRATRPSAASAAARCIRATERRRAFDGFPLGLWWLARLRAVVPSVVNAVFCLAYMRMEATPVGGGAAAALCSAEASAADSSSADEKAGPTEPLPAARAPCAEPIRAEVLGAADSTARDGDDALVSWELAHAAPQGFDAIAGPGRTRFENVALALALTVPGWGVCLGALLCGWGWSLAQHAAASFLAADIAAGVVIFASSAGKRWWHRPARRTALEQLKWMLAVGAHPFLAALLFREGPWLERARWYAIAYSYLLVAVAAIVSAPLPWRRVLAACGFMVAVAGEAALAAPCAQLPWLLPLYFFKYLCCYPIREEPYVSRHAHAD